MIKKPEEYAMYLNRVDPEVVIRWIFRDLRDLVTIAHNEGMGYGWVQNRLDQVLDGAIAPVDVEVRHRLTR